MSGFTEFCRSHAPIVVAEIGTSHQGDLTRGLELVDASADAGAHVAKFQVIFADEILPPEAGLVQLPGGAISLFRVLKSLERPVEFYGALKERTLSRGLKFLASPFGEKGFELLEEIGVEAWKIASPELNHEELLETLARTGKPLILSTGVSEIEDIRRALEVVESVFPRGQSAILLHCLTSYPAPEGQANLRTIQTLKKTFGLPVGISDHSRHAVLIPALASALGAIVIEKHITLSRDAGGLDDLVALNPEEFARMYDAVIRYAAPRNRKFEALEAHLAATIEELAGGYGRERVEMALGNGIKCLARSEIANYHRSNRSLHAIRALPAGTLVSKQNSAILRTEHNLRPGIEPRHRYLAYGRRLANNIPSGEGIRWKDLE